MALFESQAPASGGRQKSVYFNYSSLHVFRAGETSMVRPFRVRLVTVGDPEIAFQPRPFLRAYEIKNDTLLHHNELRC
jgi:hypothetical protein